MNNNTFYEIKENHEYNSREVYFNGKPSEEVRNALKALKMRWHGVKRCWYGYAAEIDILRAISNNTAADDFGGTIADGYMGAVAWYGNHSKQYLHGAELSKAIREAFKSAGIKGVSVSCKTYSGGQSLTITVKTNPSDFVSESEYINNYTVEFSDYWVNTSANTSFSTRDYYEKFTSDDREIARQAAAQYEYKILTQQERSINHYFLEKYKVGTKEFCEKLRLINRIVKSFNYDDSNGQVDYFDTNFYYTIYTKPAIIKSKESAA